MLGLLLAFLTGCAATRPQAAAPKPPTGKSHVEVAAAKTVPTLEPTYVGGKGGIFYTNMVVVLTWHDVQPKGVYDTISTANFAAEMDALQKDGFHPISPALFTAFIDHEATLPPNAVLLTFDNGCEGVFVNAWPILTQHNFPVLLFPVLGRTGVKQGFFTNAQMKTMVASGLATIGSHTYAEHNGAAAGPGLSGPADVVRLWNGTTTETWAQYDARVSADAAAAQKAIVAITGRSEPYYSDPFGQYTQRMTSLIARSGFTEDFTTLGWAVTQSTPHDRLPRINVGTGSMTASGMVASILDVARLTAKTPTWYPPLNWTHMWK